MGILKNIRQLILLRFNLRKTIAFNFKAFPAKVAIRFPVLLFGKIQYDVKRGCIVIDSGKKTDVLRIGASYGYYGTKPHQNTIYTNCGTHILKGRCDIENGGIVRILKDAVFTTGNIVKFGANARIQCVKSIEINDVVRFSWDCQLFDTDFHYILKEGGIIKKNSASVLIGSNVWVGNHVSILKNSVIPSYSVISTHSLVNKPFPKEATASIIGGIPAKIIGKGTRLFVNDYSGEGDRRLDKLFSENNINEVEINSELAQKYLGDYSFFKQHFIV